ncbi:chorismate--pyruvate lyase family protein [Pseudomaricurvus sp.]|uniref:chorismate--pyruvate lyase family protein n=1 Tax=Pseudomaricurvus sp. TaxID=2004510 RepID=UPI003F6D792A
MLPISLKNGAHSWHSATALTLSLQGQSQHVQSKHSTLLDWLKHPGSLTARLQAHSQGAFSVEVLTQHWGRAEPMEARALGISPRARVLIREVILKGHNQPWVWARSLLPERSLTGSLRHLRKLNNQPLGGWLFKQPSLQRDPLEISCFGQGDSRLPAAVVQGCDAQLQNQTLWGRRSVFYVQNKPILVGEVFLPDFIDTL